MSDTLFDPEPFSHSRKARRPATPQQVASTVVVLGGTWIGVSRTTPGVAHYIVGPKLDKRGQTVAALVAACGVVVVAHTYDPGEQRPGCAECAARVKRG